MKKILLLGGSQQQVVAIQKANELGFRTVLCDYLPDNPGQYAADVFYPVSTTDREAVLEVARRENVDGVLAYSSDPASPTAGYVAETLGLPTNPLKTIEILSEKHLFRKFMKESGLPCPQAVSFGPETSISEIKELLKGLKMPVVVKPTDSSGSKGVTVLHDTAGLQKAIHHASEFSRNGVLIAEEYIERSFPYIIGGDIFVVNGIVKFWGLMSCLRDETGNNLVPVGEKNPSGLTREQTASVKNVLQRLVTAVGVRFGELNIEVIIGQNNISYVLELGSRAGGNMIPIQLSDISGIDLIAANVLCAMDEDPGDLKWEPAGECFATYVLHSNDAGIYEGIRFSEEISRFRYRLVEYMKPGDHVEVFDGANKALGIVFLRFDNEKQMNKMLSEIGKHIMVTMGLEI